MINTNIENQKLLFRSKFIEVKIENGFIYVEEPWCNNQGVAILPYVLKDNEYYYLQIHKEKNPAHEIISKISQYSTITGGVESMDYYTTVVKEMWEEAGIDISGNNVVINRFNHSFANKSSNKKWFLYAVDLTNLNLDINKIYYGKGGDGTDFEKGIHGKFVTNESLINSNDLLSTSIKGKWTIKKEINDFHFNNFKNKIQNINESISWNIKQKLKNFFDHKNLNALFIQDEEDKEYNDSEPLGFLLHYAVDNGYFEIAEFLLKNGADVNLKDINGSTPLEIAVANPDNDIHIIKLLLKYGADVNVQDKNDCTVLDYAFNNNRIEIIKEILKYNNINDINKEKYIDILLIYFLKYNDIKSLDWLIKNFNIDYDIEDNEGFTALHWAVKNNNLDIIKFLIEKNADINAQNDFGFTALHWAVKNNNLDIIKFLIEKNADINAQNDFGFTALHWAVDNSDFEIAEFLLKNGADVNLKDINGSTPLEIAVANPDNNLKMIKLLVDNNADVNVQDNEGFTALHWAVDNSDFEIAEFFIRDYIKTDVNIKNIYGDTALHWAVDNSDFEIAEFLLKNGSNVNVQDNKGFTPLYFAVDNNDFQMVQLLLQHGANPNIQDSSCNKPLDYALNNGYSKIAQLLLKNGVNVNKNSKRKYSEISAISCKKIKLINEFEHNQPSTSGYKPILLQIYK